MALIDEPRREQFRQARRIHGGLVGLCLATLGVHLSRLPIPTKALRERLYRTIYGKKYRALNEAELERPLAEFRSFHELFTRAVRAEFRPITAGNDQLLCPCDGVVQDLGKLSSDRLLTVKGISYSLANLLPDCDTRSLESGSYVIFFLSPADCHRVFAPEAGSVAEMIHVPGRRLLVHPPYQRPEFPVFTLNERVILRLETDHGALYLVLVAGWGVGHITFPSRTTPKWRRGGITRVVPSEPWRLARGEWLATFELGSTVLMLAPREWNLEATIEREQSVRYGQSAFAIPRGRSAP